jgi:divalent metal cation (Fe/Co/Zn/Cd) transporter
MTMPRQRPNAELAATVAAEGEAKGGAETMTAIARAALAARGRHLEYFTIAWNSLEGLIAVGAGAMAGSVSLVGFGVDSFIEVTSGAALLWRMSGDADHCERERREAATLRVVGICFVALAAYVAYEAMSKLWTRTVADPSTVGIALAAVSLVVMPLLSNAKRRVATGLQSVAMRADARQTEFCTYLSAILLGGLLLRAVFGVWWADALAALVMTPIIAKEGIDGVQGKGC